MKDKIYTLLLAISILMTSCQDKSKESAETSQFIQAKDIHSFSKPNEAVVNHLDWIAEINFDAKKIEATANYQIKVSEGTNSITLDTKELDIKSIEDGQTGQPLKYKIEKPIEHLGSALVIEVTSEISSISIDYSTSANAEALQWLSPVQTAGKKHPFLFTQSQAILARSWIPIQDSPGIRLSYSAQVQVPPGLLALMSAENPKVKNDSGLYTFNMKQKIPAYLMALAVGDLEFRSLGERTGVYAEPSMLDKSAYEFAETEDMIQVAESLYGPYRWERYDLLVLPPSFPFGGMENPRLTFATPTILAGDRSLTSLVAHELAHSWSGNLVTNATWDDFWLNEGFTVYFEQRIMEALYGRSYSEMLASLSLSDLKTEVDEMIRNGSADDTRLKLNLADRNPDDGVTSIAYDKGYNFLRLVEETVGRERFDVFLKKYFSDNAFGVMDTEGFIDYLQANLIASNNLDIKPEFYKSWIYEPGLPANHPVPTSDKFDKVEAAMNNWMQNENKENLISGFGSDTWSSHEWLHFVRQLPAGLSLDQMEKLDRAFGFTETGNSEVLAAWLEIVIANQYTPGYEKLEYFLINTGRRKFLSPLYKELINTENGKTMALGIYEKARPNYHYVSSNSIDAILGLKK